MTNQSPVTLGNDFGGAKSEDVSHMGGSFRIKPNAMSIAESEMTSPGLSPGASPDSPEPRIAP